MPAEQPAEQPAEPAMDAHGWSDTDIAAAVQPADRPADEADEGWMDASSSWHTGWTSAKGKGSSRQGLEPKVIGNLVHFYRYASDSRSANWNKLKDSMDRLYALRPNIREQVDKVLYKHR